MVQVYIHEETVRHEWIDYNGHMNVAFYVLIFDHATDGILETLGIDGAYRQRTGQSCFVLESHVLYVNEVLENEPLIVEAHLVGVDEKRIHLYHEMYSKTSQQLCATNEVMLLHVDMKARKATVFDTDTYTRLRDVSGLTQPRNGDKFLGRKIKTLPEQ